MHKEVGQSRSQGRKRGGWREKTERKEETKREEEMKKNVTNILQHVVLSDINKKLWKKY